MIAAWSCTNKCQILSQDMLPIQVITCHDPSSFEDFDEVDCTRFEVSHVLSLDITIWVSSLLSARTFRTPQMDGTRYLMVLCLEHSCCLMSYVQLYGMNTCTAYSKVIF